MQAPDTVDLDQAKYDVLHHARSGQGAKTIARLMGANYGTLCNKCNPHVDTHHLTVDEAVSLQYIAGDGRIHEAEGVLLGRASIPVGHHPECSDVELLDAWAKWQQELGETAGALREALAEGRLSAAHVRRVRREMFEDFGAGLELLQRLEGLVDDD